MEIGEITVYLYVTWEQSVERRIDDVGKNWCNTTFNSQKDVVYSVQVEGQP